MIRIKRTVFLVLGATLLEVSISVSHAAERNPLDELRECARTEDSEKRIACYEALGKRVLDEEVESEDSMPPATVVENPNLEEDDEYKPIHGHVRSCQQASDSRWFFILDSGDVWKQSGGRARRFKDCDFDVTIRKDVFGYKMTIAGDDQTVRVKRHK